MATSTTNLNLSKPAYTDPADIAVINDNMDKLDGAVNGVEDGLAIVANGNTHAAVAAGQFVYVRNHSSLAQGVYKATTAIAANGALSTSNLTADASGGLNALKSDIDALNSNLTTVTNISSSVSGLHEGVNAVRIDANTVVGNYTFSENMRGYATKNGTVVVGHVSTWDLSHNVFISANNSSKLTTAYDINSNLSKNFTFTPNENAEIRNMSASVAGKSVSASFQIGVTTTSVPGWTNIGTVSPAPSAQVQTLYARGGDTEYGGLVVIETWGAVRVYSKTALNNQAIVFSLTYATT